MQAMLSAVQAMLYEGKANTLVQKVHHQNQGQPHCQQQGLSCRSTQQTASKPQGGTCQVIKEG